MKIRKGDTVHMLGGKDRGKQGRVIDAMPRESKVIVENLNVVKRATRPRPLKDASRWAASRSRRAASSRRQRLCRCPA
jgi:ribosomal protein L24